MTVPGGASARDADPERLYQAALAERWEAGLGWLHRHGVEAGTDEALDRAAQTFTHALLAAAETSALDAPLEKLFLLHTGRLYRLTEAQFERVVERLVRLHRDRPEAALGYARFCPGNPACAEAIRRHGAPVRQPVTSGDGHTVTQTRPRTSGEVATRPLFRSRQEADFFMAVRDVFAAYFAYPNVALSQLVDFERVRERLSERERRFFFRGLVDCVVFDQHAGYRPVYFFELDSPLHDDAAQQDRGPDQGPRPRPRRPAALPHPTSGGGPRAGGLRGPPPRAFLTTEADVRADGIKPPAARSFLEIGLVNHPRTTSPCFLPKNGLRTAPAWCSG